METHANILVCVYISEKQTMCFGNAHAGRSWLSFSPSLSDSISIISQKPKTAQFHFAVELIKISNEKVNFTHLAKLGPGLSRGQGKC